MKGFGAVVTGTLISGKITEGDELELLPSQTNVRVRGLQVHGKPVHEAHAGQRTAVNLAGVDTAQIERGMVLAPAGRLRPTQVVDVWVDVLPGASRDGAIAFASAFSHRRGGGVGSSKSVGWSIADCSGKWWVGAVETRGAGGRSARRSFYSAKLFAGGDDCGWRNTRSVCGVSIAREIWRARASCCGC